jgi:hypothetical protein
LVDAAGIMLADADGKLRWARPSGAGAERGWGIGHKLSQLLVGFLATEMVPLADRLAGLGIDPTPLLATTSGVLRLYADTLERPHPRR